MANEIRLRRNNIAGTTTDNPLTNVATTINSPGFVDLPTVDATNHLILILDPLETNGPAEIVRVTTHTAAASVVTVTRGAEGSSARSHAMGTTWFHGPVTSDTTEVLTSSTRPTIPYEGELIYETDTNKLVGFGGVDWAPRDAGGTLGYAQTTVDQSGISALVDLTNLSVAVTVGTGRRIKITGQARVNNDGTAGTVLAYIREGATVLNLFAANSIIANGFTLTRGDAILTPSAGAHTYKLSMEKAGAGTFVVDVDATFPAFILVEDIGAV